MWLWGNTVGYPSDSLASCTIFSSWSSLFRHSLTKSFSFWGPLPGFTHGSQWGISVPIPLCPLALLSQDTFVLTWIFRKVVQRATRLRRGETMNAALQITWRFRQWKNFRQSASIWWRIILLGPPCIFRGRHDVLRKLPTISDQFSWPITIA